MSYNFIFAMAMVGESTCIIILLLEVSDMISKRIKRNLRKNEKFMRWLEHKNENSMG